MKEATNIASKHVAKTQLNVQTWYSKRVYDEDVRTVVIVIVKNASERGDTGKLKSFREESICKILNKKPDIPVYEIVPENGHGNTKTVHKNLTYNKMGQPFYTIQQKYHDLKVRNSYTRHCSNIVEFKWIKSKTYS